MRQILEFRQVREFEIQRIYDEPAINWDGNDHNPQHRHGYVVEENQIVDDGEEEECEESESSENTPAPQPWHDFRLIFLRMAFIKLG